MPELQEQIRGLSPGALALFKKGLPQRLKELDESTRNDVMSQLRNVPEFSDLFGSGISQPPEPPEPQQSQVMKTGQKALNVFNAPFAWMGQNVTQPFGATVMSPFTPELPSGRQVNESPLAYARRQYEQWQEPTFTMPWGGKFRPTKGIIETLPWLLVPQIGAVGKAGMVGKGIAGTLGRLGTTGKVAGAAAEYSPWGLAEKALVKGGGLVGKGVGKAIAPVVESRSVGVGMRKLMSEANIKIVTPEHPMYGLVKQFGGLYDRGEVLLPDRFTSIGIHEVAHDVIVKGKMPLDVLSVFNKEFKRWERTKVGRRATMTHGLFTKDREEILAEVFKNAVHDRGNKLFPQTALGVRKWLVEYGKGVNRAAEEITNLLPQPKAAFGMQTPWQVGSESFTHFSAPSNEEIMKTITNDDWQRRVAQWFGRKPVLKNIAEAVGGKAATVTQAVEDTATRAQMVNDKTQSWLLSKGQTVMASLRQLNNNPIELFGVDEATGLTSGIKAKSGFAGVSMHIADVAEHPGKYVLSKDQQGYIKRLHDIEDWVTGGLKDAGVEVNQIKFDEFSHWVHRVVTGKNLDEALMEVRRSAGRIGSKASWEKQRFYETAAEGIKNGIIYEPNLEHTLDLYIQSAAKRIGDTRMAALINPLSRSTEVFSLPKAVKLVNAALKKQPIRPSSLKALERDMPPIAGKIKAALGIEDWADRYDALKSIRQELSTFLPTSEESLYITTEKLTAQRKSAENAVSVIQRALRGETIPTGTVKSIGKLLPEIEGKLQEKTRLTLKDLIKAGEASKGYPIELKPGSAFGTIEAKQLALDAARAALEKDPKNVKLYREVQRLARSVAFTKHRIAVGKPIQLEKSATALLTTERKEALTEMLDKIRGTPFEGKTATGKRAVRYEGGLLKDLRAKELKSKNLRADVRERVSKPIFGVEGVLQHPAFQGRILPIEAVDSVERYWADRGFKPLSALATVSGEMRTLTASADFSAMFIQGLTMIGRRPKEWAKAVEISFKSFIDPKFYQQYMVKESNTMLERTHYGGYVGGFELTEAMPQLQKLAESSTRFLGKPGIAKPFVRQTYGRFEAVFSSFGDVARNEMWKALRSRAKNEQELMEIARHLDRMTGVMSSKVLGIGKTQRDFEQAFLFFAPRYTRAGFALVADAFKGGITGSETRKALGSMMAAGAAFYTGTALALGQKPNFDPSTGKFMTIEITDPFTGTKRNVGVGGMMTSLVRFGADVTASLTGQGQNEPLDFVKMNRVDNPFIKFLYSKSAPLTGFMNGLTTGKNYFGAPFENPMDYADFIASQVTPIALHQFAEKTGASPTGVLTEEAGLRVFPESEWEKRASVRDEIAQKAYGMTWDDLGMRMGKLSQEQLTQQTPDLQKLDKTVVEGQSKMARGEGKVWNNWRATGQEIENNYLQVVQLAADEFNETQNGSVFREKVDEASKVRRALYAQREANPAFALIQEFFNEPLDPQAIAKMNPKDLARREYYQLVYAPDMYDKFGNYLFDQVTQREDYIRQKYGQAALDYVQKFLSFNRADEPPALQALRESKQQLEPYWAIADQVWAGLPSELRQLADQISIMEKQDPLQAKRMLARYPQIVRARMQIAIQRKRMKLQNPEIARILRTFYSGG